MENVYTELNFEADEYRKNNPNDSGPKNEDNELNYKMRKRREKAAEIFLMRYEGELEFSRDYLENLPTVELEKLAYQDDK